METLEIICIIISFVFGVFVSPYLKRTIENIADTHWSYRKEKSKMKSDIANNIDKQLFRLLIKAQYAIKKEYIDYSLYGCGSAFNDISNLIEYLVQFEARYQTDKNAKKIIGLHKDFDNLNKDSEFNQGLKNLNIIELRMKCINILIKFYPKNFRNGKIKPEH